MSGIYKGDLVDNQTLYFKFLSVDPATAIPATLSGTPVLSVYKDGSITQTTTGVTLTVDFDGVTGCNHVAVVTTDAFYTTSSDYSVVITTGTSGGVSVVGTPVAEFSIENRYEDIAPTAVAIRTEIDTNSTLLTDQLTESYAADGVAPSLAQAIFLIQQTLGDFSISGTTITAYQLDGVTTAATYTLDSATVPTSRTRAT